MKVLIVALGGAAGAMARYGLGLAFASLFGSRLPTGTFVVNITGSFIIGFLMTALGEQVSVSPNWRLLIGVGFIGAYTTFSALEFEALTLTHEGRSGTALAYVLTSLVLGFAAVWLGALVARNAAIPPDLAARLQSTLAQTIGRKTSI